MADNVHYIRRAYCVITNDFEPGTAFAFTGRLVGQLVSRDTFEHI
jgi:hypothetical protein